MGPRACTADAKHLKSDVMFVMVSRMAEVRFSSLSQFRGVDLLTNPSVSSEVF
jgi:hypothetical protein